MHMMKKNTDILIWLGGSLYERTGLASNFFTKITLNT